MPLQIGSKGRTWCKTTTLKIQTTCNQTELTRREYIQRVFAFNIRSGPIWNCVYSSLSDEFGRRLSSKKQTPTQEMVSRGQPHWDEETNIDKGCQTIQTMSRCVWRNTRASQNIHCNSKHKHTFHVPPQTNTRYLTRTRAGSSLRPGK